MLRPILLLALATGLLADSDVVSVRIEVYELDAAGIEAVGLGADQAETAVPSEVRRQLRSREDAPMFEVSVEGLLDRPLELVQSERYPFQVTTVTSTGTVISTDYVTARDAVRTHVSPDGGALLVDLGLQLEDARLPAPRDLPPTIDALSLKGAYRAAPGEVWMSTLGGRSPENIDRLVVLFVEVNVKE